MREITNHWVDGCPGALCVCAEGDPGADGTYRHYLVRAEVGSGPGFWCQLRFQSPLAGVDGLNEAALLAVVADRLACRQRGLAASPEVGHARAHVMNALGYLHKIAK